jgi:hypothetical protein
VVGDVCGELGWEWRLRWVAGVEGCWGEVVGRGLCLSSSRRRVSRRRRSERDGGRGGAMMGGWGWGWRGEGDCVEKGSW